MALGLLVGRFAEFVRSTSTAVPQEAASSAPEPPMDELLRRVRELCAHHVIPLSLISRADGDSAAAEQRAIVTHCVSILKRKGVNVSDTEQRAVSDYVAAIRPTLMQLDPSLKRVEQEGSEAVHRLIAAAIQVVEADGRRDPAEMRFLEEMSEELANLKARSH